ncbi:hypothetical protein LCGC14_2878100 [marine sediment metagenome]|uniref:Uncharacterized protein n=1 Tax=marine sediment metagenome TaxID=412755 RepID=A0A0F8Y162_9ZZZZ
MTTIERAMKRAKPAPVDLTRLSESALLLCIKQRYSIWMQLECNGAQYSTEAGRQQAGKARSDYFDAKVKMRRRDEM